MRKAHLGLLLLISLSFTQVRAEQGLSIAFGSCIKQQRPQPIWAAVQREQPDLFLFLGDSFYADTRDPQELTRHYRAFSASPDLRALREQSQVLAVWDDHDYGQNDAGADYPLRDLAHRLFRETFDLSPESRAWQGPGIYAAHLLPWRGRTIQIILLDTRSFRDPLKRQAFPPACPYPADKLNTEPGAGLLGAEQWVWLERQFQQPADLRLLVSSIQVLPNEHCWEKWGNFPAERQRLLQLIREREVAGLILVSGDRHFAEISRLPARQLGYPLFEITASGMNSAIGIPTRDHALRVESSDFSQDHFGLMQLKEDGADLDISLEIRDVSGARVVRQRLKLSDLRPADSR